MTTDRLKRMRAARYAKRMARLRAGAKPPAGAKPAKPPSERFLHHAALTMAKPRPVPKHLRMRTLADVLGVPPDTKLTSLPVDVPPLAAVIAESAPQGKP